MGVYRCPECGKYVSEHIEKCPHCSCPIDVVKKNNTLLYDVMKYNNDNERIVVLKNTSEVRAEKTNTAPAFPAYDANKQEKTMGKQTKRMLVSAIVLIVLICSGVIIFPHVKSLYIEKKTQHTYETAVKAIESGDYVSAYDIFVSLGDYRDSREKALEASVEIEYAKALNSIESGDYITGYESLQSLGDIKDCLSKMEEILPLYRKAKLLNSSVGDIVFFGNYNNSDLEWIVLAKENGKALLMLRDVLEKKMIFEDKISSGGGDEQSQQALSALSMKWANCSLRRWLNNTFFKDAFNEDVQSMILKEYSEQVSLLSNDEVKQYLTDEIGSKMLGTGSYWWLRTESTYEDPFYGRTRQLCAKDKNTVSSVKKSEKMAVRPIVWVDCN